MTNVLKIISIEKRRCWIVTLQFAPQQIHCFRGKCMNFNRFCCSTRVTLIKILTAKISGIYSVPVRCGCSASRPPAIIKYLHRILVTHVCLCALPFRRSKFKNLLCCAHNANILLSVSLSKHYPCAYVCI